MPPTSTSVVSHLDRGQVHLKGGSKIEVRSLNPT